MEEQRFGLEFMRPRHICFGINKRAEADHQEKKKKKKKEKERHLNLFLS
jgi:hypothetical protein